MLLNVNGIEIEIREDAFVCIDDGNASRFCEWENLTPALQEVFRTLRQDLSKKMQDFLTSGDCTAFSAVSEEYKMAEESNNCNRGE